MQALRLHFWKETKMPVVMHNSDINKCTRAKLLYVLPANLSCGYHIMSQSELEPAVKWEIGTEVPKWTAEVELDLISHLKP
jgi:hypothetical protein